MLIEGEAIRIHPLVCTAYNADFDGDQMAVHVPLSVEAQMEARLLMMAQNNIFSPSSGKPIITPTQDITLGCYYLTAEPRTPEPADSRTLKLFGSKSEVIFAFDDGGVTTHDAHPPGQSRFRQDRASRRCEQEDHRNHRRAASSSAKSGRRNWASPTNVASKSELGDLIWRCYKVCGHEKTVIMLDKLKELGFREATKAGVSIGIDDMIIPVEKDQEIDAAQKQIKEVEKQYRKGVITPGERYNKIIDIWTHCTDQISNVMFRTLEKNQGKKEYNPVSLMVDSGARGNRQQVRQLAGVRGLMAKPSRRHHREAHSVQLPRGPHGARILHLNPRRPQRSCRHRAQNRRLRLHDPQTGGCRPGCHHPHGGLRHHQRHLGPGHLRRRRRSRQAQRADHGRHSCDDVVTRRTQEGLVQANEMIDESRPQIEAAGVEKVRIRSVLTCESKHGICAYCYGRNLATGGMIKRGEAVGIIAAQSIGEPGTQLTMRTFHIGGTASQVFKQPQIKAKFDGVVHYNDLRLVELEDGNNIVLNKNGSVSILAEDGARTGNPQPRHRLGHLRQERRQGQEGRAVRAVGSLQRPHPFRKSRQGEVRRHHRGRHHEAGDGRQTTGQEAMVVIEHKEDLHPQIIITDDKGEAGRPITRSPPARTSSSTKATRSSPARSWPRRRANRPRPRTSPAVCPRVAELFEARRPKDASEISKIDGVVDFGPSVRGKRSILIKDPQTGVEEEHLIPIGKHVIVFKGDYVKKGQQLTEGPIDPHEILDICGPQELQEHLVNEVQEVYRLQGVTINDKHIEIIVRQMLRKVRVNEPGDTTFLWGEQIDKIDFEEENPRVEKMGGKPAEAQPVLLGITKASLETESFLSAASFQDTTRVLTEAATRAKVDYLRGFKENVIMGHIIPAGTGFDYHRKAQLKPLVELPEEPEPEEPALLAPAANPLVG